MPGLFMSLAMRDPDAYRQIARYCRYLLKEGGAMASPEVMSQLQQWAVECDGMADRLSGGDPDHRLEQARRHRLRAEEYRAVADQMQNPTASATYRHLAETYEAMARQLENAGAAAAPSKREAG